MVYLTHIFRAFEIVVPAFATQAISYILTEPQIANSSSYNKI